MSTSSNSKRRVLVALNQEELENEFEDDGDYPMDGKYPMEGEAFVTKHVLNAQVKEDDIEQQHGNILHTHCHVNNTVYSLIIDGGSCANIARSYNYQHLNTLSHISCSD